MKRTVLLLTAVLAAMSLVVGPQAQAATAKGHALVGVDYLTGTGGATLNAFTAACMLDQQMLQQGQTPSAINALLSSPLQGLDGYVFDLKGEKSGAFSVKGPGADAIGPEVPVVGVQFTSYDLDLHFFTAPSKAGDGCADANAAADSSNKCYSTRETPDEKTPCIVGARDAKGKKLGAHFVIVALSLNLTGGDVPFTLTTP